MDLKKFLINKMIILKAFMSVHIVLIAGIINISKELDISVLIV
jgi:hypothetical protein